MNAQKQTYIPTIGLEIHAELKTATKMFCDSPNDPDAREPNIHICPVCMAHPGTLPTINKAAVTHVLKLGLAVGGTLAEYAEFDRKNYFYPDLPKGYQISQYKYPLVSGGELAGVAITRVHLEEDTARSQHAGDYSLVDYNRAGVPLMELVTDPVVQSAEQAVHFARELQLLLRYLGASNANMEKGEMRVEANISVAPEHSVALGLNRSEGAVDQASVHDKPVLGTKVEVKNLNSFRAVERAIAFEIDRQTRLLERGEKVLQETRGWNEAKQETFAQRLKEESHDYRYFPDPDLPKFVRSELPELSDNALLVVMPELPNARRARYEALGLKPDDVETFVYYRELAKFFDEIVVNLEGNASNVLLAANYLTSDLRGLMAGESENGAATVRIDARSFAELIVMIGRGDLSSRGGKDVLALLYREGGNPQELAETHGLLQKSNPAELEKVVRVVIESHPTVAAEYRAGKESALQFLVGQGMRESRGSANPEALQKLLREELQK